MDAAANPSRWKIWSKVCFTDDVPAPEEPVIEMMGCLTDMNIQTFEITRETGRVG